MTRNGMRAFAAGMIITCAVVAFFYYFLFSGSTDTTKKTTDKPLTDSAVENYLAKKGQIAVDEKTFNEWQTSETEQANKKDGNATDTKQADDQNTAKSDDSNKSDDQATKSKDQTTTDKPKVVTIKIKSGMTSTDIADDLESKKIIKNGQDLVDYIVKHKLEKYIQLGTFKIKSDMSIAEIAKAISR